MWGKRADQAVHETEPFNAEPAPNALAESFVTPVDAFYSRNHGPIPEIDDDWRLEVGGAVERPLTLSLAELQSRFAHHEVTATLQCAGNRRSELSEVREIPGEAPWGRGATGTAVWGGARLADVLADAGARAGANHVVFVAPDVSQIADPAQPYEASVPLDKATSPEVLLAWSMNGEPLTRAHGAPLRAVVPGWIGARSVKWVQRIRLQGSPAAGYFQATGYRLLPPEADPKQAGPGDGLSLNALPVTSAILVPAPGATLPLGPVHITGYAFAGGGRGVARVDVSADGGATWQQAELGDDPGVWAWRIWHARADLDPGDHELVVRAVDTAASSQPDSAAPLWNPKGYMNNAWDRVRVRVSA